MSIYWGILAKDLRIEFRSKDILVSTLVFSILALLVFEFAFDLHSSDVVLLAPGILWTVFVFNSVLVLNRIFDGERQNSAIEALALAPIDRGVIYASKFTLSVVLMLSTELVILIIFGALFNTAVLSPAVLLGLLLATGGLAATGTSLAVVAFNSRAREVMLPILLLPLSVPVIIAAVRVTSLALAGAAMRDSVPWLNLLAAFDVLFGVACYYSFGTLLED
jgi:heme exporter protein B